MGMTIIEGPTLPLLLDNVDTDQIIAAEHLKKLTRKGLGRHAFESLKPSCPALKDPSCERAPIILAGRNFGCGSSREHAIWAILDMGVRAIIAPSFSDIFGGNAFKNGLLTVVLPSASISKIERCKSDIMINLEAGTVRAGSLSFSFEIDPFSRECLMLGLDEIGITLRYEREISNYEMGDLTAERRFAVLSVDAC
jgi:3-isopropylmalate/(R)-2-methylmalate dehydratase small subunit